jgi:hypothetical protein
MSPALKTTKKKRNKPGVATPISSHRRNDVSRKRNDGVVKMIEIKGGQEKRKIRAHGMSSIPYSATKIEIKSSERQSRWKQNKNE